MRCNCHFNHFRDCGRFWDDLVFGRCIRRHRDFNNCRCRHHRDHHDDHHRDHDRRRRHHDCDDRDW
ncbi:hypothetical protein U2I54_18610 [Bacillus pseudomycoides]|uniref:Uncharacterized protein n=1 Tax=Bacillus bingmayongensis TaxID=1150157 RepID=A0ABU5K031_9BACI|nr:hypothetical protein [Bacillus bingmayongensis]MDZ5609020.1 hypothetical protein [Bacillus pseudomycoides]